MSRRVNRIPVVLDTGNVKELSQEDIKMILRAADMCIMKAGRIICLGNMTEIKNITGEDTLEKSFIKLIKEDEH